MEDPTKREDLKGVEKAVTTLMGVIGAPIRGLFNQIGNSTVTAAAVYSVFLVVILLTAMAMFGGSINEMLNATSRANTSVAMANELNNKSRAQQVNTIGQFSVVIANYVPATDPRGEGIVIKYAAVPNASRYEAKYRINRDEFIDIMAYRDAQPDSDGLIEWFLSGAVFGTHWAPDTIIQFMLYARDADGYHTRTSDWASVRTPSQ